MQANVVYKDIRYPYIFTFTDEYMPTTAYITYNNLPVPQSYVYLSSNGWNPGVTASNQGLIGFEYSKVTGFTYGDNFKVVTSAGNITVFNYAPLSALSWSPVSASTSIVASGGYGGTYTSTAFAAVPFSAVTKIEFNSYVSQQFAIDYTNNLFTSYQNLQELFIQQTNSPLNFINLENNSNLLKCIIYAEQLSAVRLDSCVNLNDFSVALSNKLYYVDLSPNIGLERIFLSLNPSLSAVIIPSTNLIYSIDVSNCAIKSTYIDDIIINLANGNSISNGDANLGGGSNAPRTSASDTAFNTLTSRGWSVTVN